jgi:large subunit ribosomal protein L4
VPKKVRSLARRSALNDRAENDRVVLADMPSMDAPKTRDLLGYLGAIGTDGKVLVLTDGKNDNIYLSARNVSRVSILPFGTESVYDVLWAHTVVIERSALDEAETDTEPAKPAKKKSKVKKAEVEEDAEEEPTDA